MSCFPFNLFSHTTFTLLTIFSSLQMISIKIWETTLSWHANWSLPVAANWGKCQWVKSPPAINLLHERTQCIQAPNTTGTLSVRESQQKRKNSYGNPDKILEKIIKRNNSRLKKPNLIAIAARFLPVLFCFFHLDAI